MRIRRNTGTDRVIDVMQAAVMPGGCLDALTPAFSVFAFEALKRELEALPAR